MRSDMVTEVLTACNELRAKGPVNKNAGEVIAEVFGCKVNHPTFYYLVAALMGQFSELESEITRSTHFTENEKNKALGQIRGISAFLQPGRIVRPWQEVMTTCFKPENFGFEFMRSGIAQEFPINSLTPDEIEKLILKITSAISEIVKFSGAPPIVVSTLTNSLDAVLQILRHFKFYGTAALQKELAYAFTTAVSLQSSGASDETKKASKISIAAVAAIAYSLFVGGNDLVNAVEDWSERGSTMIEYIASHSPQLLLPAPEATRPKKEDQLEPPTGDNAKNEE